MKQVEQIKKMRSMKDSEIVSEIRAQKNELSLNALKVGAGKLDNYSKIQESKKNIARLNTILNEKRYGVEDGK